MQLTQRQCETIYHLKQFQGIEGKDQIIAWAKKKLEQLTYNKNLPHRSRRDHPKEYYEQIITYLESAGNKNI